MGVYLPVKSLCGRALLIALSLLIILFVASAGSAYANTVTINDQSDVLNASKIRSDAAQLPVSVLIYTTRTFTGDQAALNNDARSRLSGANTVDIAIDTTQRHLSIESGVQVKLSNDQASNAVDTFKSNFNNGDYTGATIAAIDSIHDALTGRSSSGSITPLGAVVAIILGVILSVIILFVMITTTINRRRGGPPKGGRRWGNQIENRSSQGYYPYPVYPNNSGANNPGSSSGAGSSFGSGGFGGGAGGSFGGGGSTGGGAGGSF